MTSPSLGPKSEAYDAVSEISHSRRGGRKTPLISITALDEFADLSLVPALSSVYACVLPRVCVCVCICACTRACVCVCMHPR